MKRVQSVLAVLFALALPLSVLGEDVPADKAVPEGFTSLFDGKTLDGWDGNPELWSVEDGCITGRTFADPPLKSNTFLSWKDEVNDFELVVDFCLTNGNSGIQYRAFTSPGHHWSLRGYQADVAGVPHMGIVYGEGFRGILANVGESVVWRDGKKAEVERFADAKDLHATVKFGGWNTYRIVVKGNHMVQYINGVKMSEMVDEDGVARDSGLLGFQLHVGPPMKVQYKNVFIKQL